MGNWLRLFILSGFAGCVAWSQTVPPFHAEYFDVQEFINADGSSRPKSCIGTLSRSSNGSTLRQCTGVDSNGRVVGQRKELFDTVGRGAYVINDTERKYYRRSDWKLPSMLLQRPKRTDIAAPREIEGLLCHAFPVFGNGQPGNRDRVGTVWIDVGRGIDVLQEMDYLSNGVRIKSRSGVRAIRFEEPPFSLFQLPVDYTLGDRANCCRKKIAK